jgi:trk system potassium uptake protein TrkA
MARKYFILGAGRFGVQLARRLNELGCDVIIGDRDAALVQSLADQGFRSARLDADEAGDLKEAGVLEADAVVVAIGEDMQASVLSTITLKELGVKPVIARATTEKHAEILKRLGADQVIAPDREAAHRLAEQLYAGSTEQRLPFHGEYQVARVRLGNKLAGKTWAEAALEEKHRVTPVLCLRKHPTRDEVDEFLPAPKETLMPGDLVYLVGHKEDINTFEDKFGFQPE